MDTRQTTYVTRSQAYEASEDIGRNPSTAPSMGDVIATRFGRRDVMRGALAVSAVTAVLGPMALTSSPAEAQTAAPASRYTFTEIEHGVDETHHVAPGYSADVLIRWGDPVLPGAPAFDPMNQTAAAQEQQFGYNCDYVGYVGLPLGSNNPDNGLLFVSHEYTNEEVMFPGLGGPQEGSEVNFRAMTPELFRIEMAAHGASVIEIEKVDGKWQVKRDSQYNRRISPLSTRMAISGPAAGHDRMKTSADPAGTTVIGTINNCAGGTTPWGTFLTAEENFHGYFLGDLAETHPEQRNFARYGIPGKWYGWGTVDSRFNVNEEPNEANRFGWIVEVDPTDPASMPKKRTALGRFKHENAEVIVNKDGRVVVYSGDDERFEYVYKFVSEGRFDPNNRAANMDLLDQGTLYVAKYDADGSVTWMPLTHGEGPLTAENGFNSQADVVIEARRAADLLGATRMDRPEDVEANPVTNKIYVNLTNNSRRKAADADPEHQRVNAANPRPENRWGHIIEMTPPDEDHAATRFTWEILVKCGDPAAAPVGAMWNPATSANGWFSCPDNMAFDSQGRLWISTDQGEAWKRASGTADGIWGLETEGALRGTGKMFFRVPVGAEMCGPLFAPDDKTLFVAVQHPATDGVDDFEPFGRASTFEDPATRWPDFQPNMPPRPSVVAITKEDGGVIGV